MIPGPWVGLVLALAVFRACRLAGWDNFPPIVRLRARITGERVMRSASSTKPIIEHRRPLLAEFIGCAFCLGAWLSLGAYLAWRFAPTETLYAAAPLALSAAAGIIAKVLDP